MSSPLKRIRVQRGESLDHVAIAVSASKSTLSKIENGKAGASPALAARLAKHFGCAVTEMQILYPERFTDTGSR